MSYLKPKQEYIDSYDRLTVDYFREKEKEFEDIRKKKNKKVPEKDTEEYLDVLNKFLALGMYCIIGDKYEQKEKTIKKWMELFRL